jgi:S-adenosylmethionine/arginine decarboxylase-like enzyme
MTTAMAAPEINTDITTPANALIAVEGHLPGIRPRHSARHLLAEWRDCRQSVDGLRNADTMKRLCLRLCSELHLKVAGNGFFQFEPTGVAGTILLDGSHVAIHTWPERNMLKADIHLEPQNLASNAAPAALVLMERLMSCFQPAFSSIDPGRRLVKLN